MAVWENRNISKNANFGGFTMKRVFLPASRIRNKTSFVETPKNILKNYIDRYDQAKIVKMVS